MSNSRSCLVTVLLLRILPALCYFLPPKPVNRLWESLEALGCPPRVPAFVARLVPCPVPFLSCLPALLPRRTWQAPAGFAGSRDPREKGVCPACCLLGTWGCTGVSPCIGAADPQIFPAHGPSTESGSSGLPSAFPRRLCIRFGCSALFRRLVAAGEICVVISLRLAVFSGSCMPAAHFLFFCVTFAPGTICLCSKFQVGGFLYAPLLL
ncbi:hypothetical protein C8R43DRAFT_951951 [Mycena crocata]|nr:hypothetical protein C8R43DRAFT_951951 [Mycena crocata]